MSKTRVTYLIGVDGGGSGCRAALADAAGRVLGQGAAGPANATTDLAQAIGNVQAALKAALREAGVKRGAVGAGVAHVGLAGVLDEATARQIAAALPVGSASVTDDRATSLVGALGARDGVLAAIGTGSTLAAQRGGRVLRIGGWGLNLGDQASGAWLGRAVLEHVLLVHDGLAEATALSDAVLAEFDGDPGAIVGFAARARPSDYAGQAPRIVAMALGGDAAARMLMQRGADYLLRALEVMEFGGADVLCLGGGLGPQYAAFLPEDIRARIRPPEGSALEGALALAKAALERRA
ncbi:MAG: N-acetylglucosamine kinase [Rhodobacteraceae bacterium]|nr:MAG: N-acetylglucosamine kinase [Paracoccaceae bacterium]